MKENTPIALRIEQLSHNLSLYVHREGDLYVSRRIREEGVWEPYETDLILSLLQPADVVVDVGANLGYFTVLAAATVGDTGQVFAFEPDPANFALLEANARLNCVQHRITAVQAGLDSAGGEGRLFLSEDNLGDHQIFSSQDTRSSLPITLLDGAEFLAPKLQRLDLLKIDTQGSEYRVMCGLMPLLLQLPQPPRVIIELTPLSLRQAGASGRSLIELLAGLEQPMWIIDHIEHQLVPSAADELASWCDNVDAVAGDAGFMNILVGPGP